ncbi:MAG TPA: MFS transporter [Caulobacteraceae bacterium]|jgi:DHA1 family tetracycline resistance protein-like MFS transporter
MSRGPRPAFGFIFTSVLMSAVSSGLIFPVLPNLIRSFFGAVSAATTAAAAEWQFVFGVCWGAMQFVAGPVLGMLSDRFGRRPVLLISLLGLSLDLLVMTFAPSLTWLLVGRVLSGLTSANFATASAYVADISPPDQRAKNFGWISAGLSAGFLVGPAAAGVLATQAVRLGTFALDPLRTPFLVVAALCAANWIYGLVALPESLAPARRMKAFDWARANPAGSFSLITAHRELALLAAINFLTQIAMLVMPAVFVLYATLRYHWSLGFLGVTIALVAVVQILVQWIVVGPVVRHFGERTAMIAGYGALIAGFTVLGLSANGSTFFIAMPIFELGGGIASPSLQGLMSRCVPASEQGRLQGAVQASGGVAAIVAPAVFPLSFAWALRRLPALPGLPIVISAGLMALALAMTLISGRQGASAKPTP